MTENLNPPNTSLSDWDPNDTLELNNLAKDLTKDDDLGAVVRGHIRLENLVLELLDLLAPKPEYLKRLRLSYERRVNLALLLGMDEELGPPLLALGKLRNEFAHKIGTELTKQRVNNLYDALDELDKEQFHVSLENIQRDHEAPASLGNFERMPPKDRFCLITVVLWGRLGSLILQLRTR